MPDVRARVWSPVVTVLVAASAAVALSAACTDDFEVTPVADAGGDDATPGERAQCPRDPPNDGTPCTLPEGTTCSFGQCAVIVQCARGEWRQSPSAKPPCPELPPGEQTACPRCWPTGASCNWGACTGPDASDKTSIASCPNGVWSLAVLPCPDGGGPDVQGDGEAADD
jgi:hypothetical protein